MSKLPLTFDNILKIKRGSLFTAKEIADILGISRSVFDYNFKGKVDFIKQGRRNMYPAPQTYEALVSYMRDKVTKKLANEAGLVPGKPGKSDHAFKTKWNINKDFARMHYNVQTERFDDSFWADMNIYNLYDRL